MYVPIHHITQLPVDIKKVIFEYLTRTDQVRLTSTGSKTLFNERRFYFKNRIWVNLPNTETPIAHIFQENGSMVPTLPIILSLTLAFQPDKNLLVSAIKERPSLFQALKTLHFYARLDEEILSLITTIPNLSLQQLLIGYYSATSWPKITLNSLLELNIRTGPFDRSNPLTNDFFKTIPNLQKLTLQLSPPVFLEMVEIPELIELSISYNTERESPDTLPSNFLSLFPKLQKLSFNIPSLKKLPVESRPLTQLTEFSLTSPSLIELPEKLSILFPQLEILMVDFIRDTPFFSLNCPPLPKLTKLTLLSYNIQTLPENFNDRYPQLQQLSISYGLTHIPKNLNKLTELDLSLWDLFQLPEDFGNHFKALRKLKLGANTLDGPPHLTSLPESFAYLTALEDLAIYSKGLTILPEYFGTHFTKLRRLTIEAYQLQTFPTKFAAHPKLTDLVIFSAFPPILWRIALSQLENLKDLSLYFVSLKYLPEDLAPSYPTRVTRLGITANALIALPEDFGLIFPNVEYLNLSLPALQKIPSSFENLTHLIDLSLYVNTITTIPDNFAITFKQLRTLELCVAKIEILPLSLTTLTQLRKLSINSCKSINYPEIFNYSFPKIPEFRFNGKVQETVKNNPLPPHR